MREICNSGDASHKKVWVQLLVEHRHCLCHPTEVAAHSCLQDWNLQAPSIYLKWRNSQEGWAASGRARITRVRLLSFICTYFSGFNKILSWLYLYSYVGTDSFIFSSHLMILMKCTDSENRTVWEVLKNCWEGKQRHLQHVVSHKEPTYILTARNNEIQVHTIDSKLLTHIGREGRLMFFNISTAVYMQVSTIFSSCVI